MNIQMQRLYEAALKLKKVSGQSAVGRVIGASPQQVKNWESRGISYRGLVEAARMLGCSIKWLETGEGDMTDFVGFPGAIQLDNASPSPVLSKKIPIISWVRAGMFDDATDLYLPGEADEWIRAESSNPGAHAFALIIEGDSMTAPIGSPHSFPDGCKIIVDPDRSPKAGDYVVAKDVTTQKATFKKLTTDGSRWYLKPLNTSYPLIEIDDPSLRVIGVAIEWQTGGKL